MTKDKKQDSDKQNQQLVQSNNLSSSFPWEIFAKSSLERSSAAFALRPLDVARLRIIDPSDKNKYSSLTDYYSSCVKNIYSKRGIGNCVKDSYSGVGARVLHTSLLEAVRFGFMLENDRVLGSSEGDVSKGLKKSALTIAGVAVLCPIETMAAVAALDPKNGLKEMMQSYKDAIPKGRLLQTMYPSETVYSVLGVRSAGVVSMTLGGDYINAKFRDENGNISRADAWKASAITGAATSASLIPLELFSFWGRKEGGGYSLQQFAKNVLRATQGAGVGFAAGVRVASAAPLIAIRNMARIEAEMQHTQYNGNNWIDRVSSRDSSRSV